MDHSMTQHVRSRSMARRRSLRRWTWGEGLAPVRGSGSARSRPGATDQPGSVRMTDPTMKGPKVSHGPHLISNRKPSIV
jgi:hypothetical protein